MLQVVDVPSRTKALVGRLEVKDTTCYWVLGLDFARVSIVQVSAEYRFEYRFGACEFPTLGPGIAILGDAGLTRTQSNIGPTVSSWLFRVSFLGIVLMCCVSLYSVSSLHNKLDKGRDLT